MGEDYLVFCLYELEISGGIIFSKKNGSDPMWVWVFARACVDSRSYAAMLVDTDLDMSRRRLLGTYPG